MSYIKTSLDIANDNAQMPFLRPTKNFRLASTTKYLLSTMVDAEARSTFRRNMIQAQLQSEIKPSKEKDEKKK